jgi:hypothetical protein
VSISCSLLVLATLDLGLAGDSNPAADTSDTLAGAEATRRRFSAEHGPRVSMNTSARSSTDKGGCSVFAGNNAQSFVATC